MNELELRRRGLPAFAGVRDGDRVSFKVLPEAHGTVVCGVYGGKVQIELDGTLQRVWVAPEEVTKI